MSIVKLKKSSVPEKIPLTSDLDYGEIAVNYADGVIYYKNTLTQIQSIGSVQSTALSITTTTSTISTTTGALIVAGGVGVGGNMFVGGTVTATNITANGRVLAQSGTKTLPAFGNIDSLTSGIFFRDSGRSIAFSSSDEVNFQVGTDGTLLGKSTSQFGWSAVSPDIAGGDLFLARDAANTLAQRNSTNAQTFRLYNTYTDSSNYERLGINWTGNTVTIQTENLGTGVARNLAIGSTGTNITINGAIVSSSTTSSTSTTTGALVVKGGVGVGGDLHVGGTVTARVNPRVTNIASGATITPPSDTVDQYGVTALAVPATIAIPSGTPVDGQKLVLRIEDNGTARALTWTTSGANSYRVVGTTLSTATVISKLLYVGCIYNAIDSFWDVVAVAQQA